MQNIYYQCVAVYSMWCYSYATREHAAADFFLLFSIALLYTYTLSSRSHTIASVRTLPMMQVLC